MSSSFRLGRRDGRNVQDDVITRGITMDQYARREDDRKGRLDPMRSFVVGSVSTHRRRSTTTLGMTNDGNDANDRKNTRRCRRDDDDGDASRKRIRRSRVEVEGGKGMAEDEHRRREKESGGRRSSDERHGRKEKPSRGGYSREYDDRHRPPRGDRRRRGSSTSRGSDDKINDDVDDGQKFRSINADELDELRRRRHAREAREMERERNVIMPRQCAPDVDVRGYGRGGKYQDQFNPTLSRN